jgi:hypothetical protein
VADVRRNFVDLFTPAELDTLATLNERILHHLAEGDGSPAEDEAEGHVFGPDSTYG